MKNSSTSHPVSFDGIRPLALTKKQAIFALGSSKLVTRMLWASRHAGDPWLLVVRPGRDLLIDTRSVEAAYRRMLLGELPPLMPCERRGNLVKTGSIQSGRLRAGRKRKLALGRGGAKGSGAGSLLASGDGDLPGILATRETEPTKS